MNYGLTLLQRINKQVRIWKQGVRESKLMSFDGLLKTAVVVGINGNMAITGLVWFNIPTFHSQSDIINQGGASAKPGQKKNVIELFLIMIFRSLSFARCN